MSSLLKHNFSLCCIVLGLFGTIASGCGDDVPPPGGPMVTITVPDAACDDADCTIGGRATPICGDGIVDLLSETCDDGNKSGGDGCNAACLLETCGNGTVDPGEGCDPPGTATCSPTCVLISSSCGNSQVEADKGEQCDDGNEIVGDGCRGCRTECGDGFLDRSIGEQCEPQFTKQENGVGPTCMANCRRFPYCGDGVKNAAGEECEPVNGKNCVGNCKLAQAPDAGANECVPIADAGAGGVPTVENLVPNPSFVTDIMGWNAGPSVTAVYSGAEGATAPGSAKVTFTAAALPAFSVDGLSRCVAVTAGEFFEFKAKYFNPPAQRSDGIAFPVVLLYSNATCSGSALSSGAAGSPTSVEPAKWLDYKRVIDTTTAGTKGAVASLMIKLGVLVPAGKTSTVLWDDVSLRGTDAVPFDPNCGNCIVDKGETCDDGNRVRGDGCGAFCQRERECGNGTVELPEACDLGKVAFTDAKACTPLCKVKTPCDQCAIGQCRPQVDVCYGMQGVAQAGPRQGEERSLLCARLRDCALATGCARATAISARTTLSGMPGPYLENCYCGNSGTDCLIPGLPNGSCRAEVEAALETKNPHQIIARVGGTNASYPIFAAVNELLLCQDTECKAMCMTTLKCGDGVIQDRSNEFAISFALLLPGKSQMCIDGLTPSGKGCSFEECDGTMSCDENCFILKCGNKLKQKGEDCDDGNNVSGDGCDANCKAEFKCGDNKVDDKFGEQCDPPNTGPICTLAESKSDPSKCGCGSTCQLKACGNGIVQEGEECDPPNGASCTDQCKRAGLNECTQCLLLVTADEIGKAALEGLPGTPGFEQGCLNDKPCRELLECILKEKCGGKLAAIECYCGTEQASIDSCESEAFVPKGPCKTETLAAYAAQYGIAAENNAAVIRRYLDQETPLGRSSSFFIPEALADFNFYQPGNPLAARLKASKVSDAKIVSCVAACGLPWK